MESSWESWFTIVKRNLTYLAHSDGNDWPSVTARDTTNESPPLYPLGYVKRSLPEEYQRKVSKTWSTNDWHQVEKINENNWQRLVALPIEATDQNRCRIKLVRWQRGEVLYQPSKLFLVRILQWWESNFWYRKKKRNKSINTWK